MQFTMTKYLLFSANILLSEDWRGRLGDFGLARALLPSSQHSSVLTSTIVGTSLYMSPEAVNGTISPAADVYAFGVVSHETSQVVLSDFR